MVSGLNDLSADTYFGIARTYGRDDPVQWKSQGNNYLPIGLGEFKQLAEG